MKVIIAGSRRIKNGLASYSSGTGISPEVQVTPRGGDPDALRKLGIAIEKMVIEHAERQPLAIRVTE